MKKTKRIALCMAFIWVSAAVNAQDAYHVFTDHEGNTIEAKIISATEDEVKIERVDGMKFETPISLYSKKDQAYIQSWLLDYKNTNASFEINARIKKGKRKKTSSASYKQKEFDLYYEITIENRNFYEHESLEIRYVMYKQAAQFGGLDDSAKMESRSGHFKIPLFSRRGKRIFETVRMKGAEKELEDGWYFTNGADDKSKDELKGLWLKIYNGDRLIYEYAEPESITSKQSWAYGKRQGSTTNPFANP